MTSVIEQQNISLPPSPPTVIEEANALQLIHPDLIQENDMETPPQAPLLTRVQEKIIPGKFEYVKDWEKEMLVNAWQAITLTENWSFMKQPIKSYSWSDDPRVAIISKKMVELGYDGHSGCSFGCTMRAMQYIAQNGEEKYKEMREEK